MSGKFCFRHGPVTSEARLKQTLLLEEICSVVFLVFVKSHETPKLAKYHSPQVSIQQNGYLYFATIRDPGERQV